MRIRALILSTLLICFSGSIGSFAQVPETVPTPAGAKPVAPIIILKLDDLTADTPGWKRTVQLLKDRNIKSSIGIICNSLEKDRPSYIAFIKEVEKTGLVEFWSHGLDHKDWQEGTVKFQEFKGPTYEIQKEHFSKAQQLAKEKLGITLRTFGAPFNATDANTLKVLAEDPDVKVFLYGSANDAAAIPNVMILERTEMNIENPLFVPNTERVEHDLKILGSKRDCFVIQGHPNQWDDARFAEFTKMVDYLISQGVTFMTPYDYYLLKKDGVKPVIPVPVIASAPAAAPASVPGVAAVPMAAAAAPVKSAEGQNILINGNYEAGMRGWQKFVPPESINGECVLEITSEEAHAGKCLKLTSTSDARFAATQVLKGTWVAGDRYRVSIWVRAGEDFKAAARTPGFSIRIGFFADGQYTAVPGGGFHLGLDNKTTRGMTPPAGEGVPTTWTKTEGVYEIPPDTAMVNVAISMIKGTGSLFVDDVSIEKVDNSTPLSE